MSEAHFSQMVQFLYVYFEAHFDEYGTIGRNANLSLAWDIFLFINQQPHILSAQVLR